MNRGDRWLLALPLALTAVGVIMVYSSSAILGITRHQDPDYFMARHLVRVALGLAVLAVCARIDLRRLEAMSAALLVGAAVLLALVGWVGYMSNGATRWLRLGMVTLQPTDVARLVAVVFLARWLKRHPPVEEGPVRGLLPPLLIVGGLAGLILVQPNLSSAVLLLTVGIVMVFIAGASPRQLAVPALGAGVAAAIALLVHPYMLLRLQSYLRFVLDGTLDARGSGWQLDQSLIAIGSGGWVGRGVGGGLQKYMFLPEPHTDFIFSVLAEELGFLGATVLLSLFGLLLWRGLRAAARATDPFASLLAAGLSLQIGLYAVVNLAVATGLAPTTGLPLPFVSYGGSALLANMAAAGLLYRVSVRNGDNEALARRRWSAEAA